MAKEKLKYKRRISNFVAGMLITGVLINYALVVGFSLTGVGEVASEMLDFIEDIALATAFLFLGAYSSSKKSSQNAFVTGVCSVVALLPYINDLPVGVIEVLSVVYTTRKEDREQAEAKAAAEAKQAEIEQENQILRIQASQAAEVRANAVRAQALATSIATANDNTYSSQQQAA